MVRSSVPILCVIVTSLASAQQQVVTPAPPEPCRAPLECVPLSRCPSALRAMQESPKRRPQHCGFNATVPDVCCPPRGQQQQGDPAPDQSQSTCSTSVKPVENPPAPVVTCAQLAKHYADNVPPDATGAGSVARRMCRKQQEDLCAMPKKQPGETCPSQGAFARIVEFPHMALLGYGERDSVVYSCGGSLVSPDFILTAAHCLKSANGAVRWALLGSTNRTGEKPNGNDTFQIIEVVEVTAHPEYVAAIKYHDIALLRLARAAVIGDNVRPACLQTDLDMGIIGQEAVATGWGATDFAGDGSESLIKVNLTVRDLQYCRDKLASDKEKLPQGLVDTQLCAGGGPDGRDTCPGDSGGPLQVSANPNYAIPCMHRVVGVVSFGPPCGLGLPGIYSRVAAYVDWIESIVWPTKSDGCARASPPLGGDEVPIPYTGPGSVARGMCAFYHAKICPAYEANAKFVKPDISVNTLCHHNHQEAQWPRTTKTRIRETSPTMVTLIYGNSVLNQHACAGALISPRAVITAARCQSLACLPLKAVTLNSPFSCNEAVVFKVESVRVHPGYRRGEAYADLAVVFLSQSVDPRNYNPLCLDTPEHGAVRPGMSATAAAWNMQAFSWESIRYARANTSLSIRGTDECAAALLADDRLKQAHPKGFLPSQLCAGGLCDQVSYAGERGVPLTVRSHTLRSDVHGDFLVDRVLGVASSLSYCSARTASGARLPDLFTSVASHVAWLESVVWSDQQ